MSGYPRHWLAMTLGVWLVSGIVLGGLPWLSGMPPDNFWQPSTLFLPMASGALLSMLLLVLAVRTDVWPPAWQAASLIGAALVLGLAQAAIDHAIYALFRDELMQELEDWTAGIGFNFLFYLWILLLYAAGVKLLLVARARQQKEAEIAAEEAGAAAAALSAIRYQINPELLFGTLGSASALVDGKQHEKARQMVDRLADFLRWSLTAGDRPLSSLGDELAALDAYFEIETVRFGSRLSVAMDCPPGLFEVQTPSFLLQPLAEYLIRTGIVATGDAVRITISASSEHPRLHIVLRDNCVSADEHSTAELDAARARLAELYGSRASLVHLIDGGGRALRVTIPLRLHGANNPSTPAR